MRITSVTWGSDISLLVEACAKLGIALSAWTPCDLEDKWNADSHELGSTEIGWSVEMPKFAGATMQRILKNPLASPYTHGIASDAASRFSHVLVRP
ncbi:MAG: iron chelate uptake ABC transporter family permease subunit [Methanosarcinales archaeon]|uniref:Iron chelate uptake ABC transporter family permease subunit n=1 Tax=Candidatus Ethanoperedens thermophilum TaxID=2766897 RepID=A0A848D9T8_9EURY|nr:iron chelate uptake ABC transporter family permease subunit [Candidatus Ethanoperedens thermophilum]